MVETFLQYLMVPAAVLLSALLGLAASYVSNLTKRIKDERIQNEIDSLIWRVKDEIADAVKHTAQNYVDDIKEARSDGNLTEEEKAEANRRAVELVLSRLGETGRRELDKIVGDATEWISEKVDAMVYDLKKR